MFARATMFDMPDIRVLNHPFAQPESVRVSRAIAR